MESKWRIAQREQRRDLDPTALFSTLESSNASNGLSIFARGGSKIYLVPRVLP
jgi:hypothetical protein